MGVLKAVFWNERERRPRALWRLLLLLAVIGLVAVAPIIGIGEGLAALYREGVWLPGQSHAMFDKSMDFIVGPLFTILLIAAVMLTARFVDRRDWLEFGLKLNKAWWADLAFGLALGAALIVIVFVVEVAFGWVTVERRLAPGVVGVPTAMLWAFVAVKMLCVGTYEEIVSRGSILKNVAEGLSALPPAFAALSAALVTALVFGALHATTPNFSTASFFGLVSNGVLLAAPVLLTGRLAMSMSLHMAWNFTQGGIFGYPVSGDVENISWRVSTATGPTAWTGGAYGPEAGYLAAVTTLIGVVAIGVVVRLRTGHLILLPQIAQFRPRIQRG